jgi:hypothetical protein
MKPAQCLAAGLIFAASFVLTASAQQPNPHNGAWIASFEGDKGTPQQAEVVIKDAAGTWMNTRRTKGNPCMGKTMPLAVSRATANEIEFAVHSSTVLSGCTDYTFSFKRVGDKAFEGLRDDGRKITLQRQ